MTTYIIFSDVNDGTITSYNANFATAQSGSNLSVDTTGEYLRTGMNIDGSGNYHIHQSFYSFDTSVIADAEEIIDVTLTAYVGFGSNQSVQWGQQFREFNWTAPLTTAQWQTPTLVSTRPVVANFDYLFSSTPYQWRVTGRDTLTTISKTSATKFVSVSNTFADGYGTSGVQEIWTASANSVNKPYLTVYTTSLNTLNGVTEASTTLADGTTISVRSNGTASPTLTVGYNTLTSSTWTSIGTLHADFTKNIDGTGALSVVADPSGNFYIIGVKSGTAGTLIAQAYEKVTSTSWTAKTPLSASLPIGNEQTVRSISVVYNVAGKDSTDLPGIYGVAVRGSGGNRPSFPYHTSGAGYAHDFTLDPVALLSGSGALFKMSAIGFAAITETAAPVHSDVVVLGPNSFATYTQRGKAASTVLGGIQIMGMYQGFGLVKENNRDYVATGASQLVAISPTVFAHVFDSEGVKLVVRFYNDQAQVLGETSIQKDVFYGGVIGTQFGAYYDKAFNLLRVFYVDSSSSRTISRFDVSPVTFVGTTTASALTNVGPASSLNTDIRISRTSDERRLLIETANNSAGTLSTVSSYTVVGNYAPSAPALLSRQNFDSTSSAIFDWTFGDQNVKDVQTAYQLEISRVSDSVVVHDTGKITSPSNTFTLPANTIANGVSYRWRVRTYDVVDAVGTWSSYGTFATAATGTLTITSPSLDNSAGIDTSSYTVQWTYVQSGGATQSQRKVRLIRTADNTVLLDTGMQVSGANGHVITGLESGKEYRVEVTVINSASVTTPVVTRLITPYYSEPMIPSLTISQRESHIELVVINPSPTGDRPQIIENDIYRRKSGINAKDSDFIKIATVTNSATYKDYSVKSGTSYDYYVVGRTN